MSQKDAQQPETDPDPTWDALGDDALDIECLELMLEAEEPAPEEAGYGHGV